LSFFFEHQTIIKIFSFIHLFIYLLFSTITDAVSFIFINNLEMRIIIQYFFTIFEILLISKIYLNFFNKINLKITIKLSSIFFVIFYLSYLSYSKSFNKSYFYFEPVEYILIIFYSISLFYKKFNDSNDLSVMERNFLIINSAFLIHFGSNFFLFLFRPYFDITNTNFTYVLGLFYLIISILYNSIISIGVWKIKTT
jgi:hypothetical protein